MNLKSLLMFAACFSLLTVDGSCMQNNMPNNNYRQRQHSLNTKPQQPVLQKQSIPQRSNAVNKDRKSQINNMLNGSKQQKQGRMFNQQGPRMGLQGNQFSNQMSGVKQPDKPFTQQMPGVKQPDKPFTQQMPGVKQPDKPFTQQMSGVKQPGQQFSNQMPGFVPPGQQFSNQMPGFIPPGQQFRQQFNQPGQGFQQYGMQQQRPMNSSYTYSNAQIKTTPTTPRQKTGKKQMNNMKPYRSNNIMQNQQFAPGNSAYGMQYQQQTR